MKERTWDWASVWYRLDSKNVVSDYLRFYEIKNCMFIGTWILSTLEEKYFKFSNSPDWKFWRDNSWSRSALNDALSKWLKSLYWINLGLCFTWKTFRTVNVNLWSQTNLPHKYLMNEYRWMWSIRTGFSRLLKQVDCFINFLRLHDVQNFSK